MSKKPTEIAAETGAHVIETHGSDYEAQFAAVAAAEDEAASGETDMAASTALSEYQGVVQGAGRRITTAWTMSGFVPDLDWIMKTVVSQGRGTHMLVGRIAGEAVSTERKTNLWQGKSLESIAIFGSFTAVSVLPDANGAERPPVSVSVVYLPRAFALQVEMALKTPGVLRCPLDIDIGVEATGKTIPYEWTVYSYLEGRAERAMRELLSSRQIGRPAPATQRRLI